MLEEFKNIVLLKQKNLYNHIFMLISILNTDKQLLRF